MTLLIDHPAVRLRPAGFVRVAGHDRLTYLQNLLSQDLEQATPGACADFLYLDAKGNALAVGRALVRAGDVILVVPAEVAADLTEALERFKFLMDSSATDVSDEWALASVRGPEPVDVPGARSERMTAAPHGGGMVVRDRTGGVDYAGPVDWVHECLAGLELPSASAEEWEAWRILAGQPDWQHEISAGRRAQELGLLPTHVHLRKGCYPGQESIAKTYNLGHPRRALAVVSFDGPVERGTPVAAGDKQGQITSAAAADGRWVALVLLPVGRDGVVPGDGVVTAAEATGRLLRKVGQGLPQPGV